MTSYNVLFWYFEHKSIGLFSCVLCLVRRSCELNVDFSNLILATCFCTKFKILNGTFKIQNKQVWKFWCYYYVSKWAQLQQADLLKKMAVDLLTWPKGPSSSHWLTSDGSCTRNQIFEYSDQPKNWIKARWTRLFFFFWPYLMIFPRVVARIFHYEISLNMAKNEEKSC